MWTSQGRLRTWPNKWRCSKHTSHKLPCPNRYLSVHQPNHTRRRRSGTHRQTDNPSSRQGSATQAHETNSSTMDRGLDSATRAAGTATLPAIAGFEPRAAEIAAQSATHTASAATLPTGKENRDTGGRRRLPGLAETSRQYRDLILPTRPTLPLTFAKVTR